MRLICKIFYSFYRYLLVKSCIDNTLMQTSYLDSLIKVYRLRAAKNAAEVLLCFSLREQQKSINTIFIDLSPSLKVLAQQSKPTITVDSYQIKIIQKRGILLSLHHPVQVTASVEGRRVRSRSLSANGTRQKRNRNAGQSLCSVRPPALARPPVPGNDNHYRGMIAASGPPARQPRYWGMETTL